MALESIKSKFSSVTDVLLLRGDAVAEKVLIAWIRYRPAFKDSAAAKGEDESSTLDRLWEGVGPINFKKLGAIAGLPETVAEKSFRHLQAALIVWPDGTITPDALRFLIGMGNAHLRGLLPKTTPAAAPPKKEEPSKTKR
jgi:hypothetical protein